MPPPELESPDGDESTEGPPELAEGPEYMIGATQYAYAEHAYPGKKIVDLASVQVLLHNPTGFGVPGYQTYVTPAVLKDGAAAVTCGAVGAVPYDKVTFVLP